jgi:O-antigen/teichoic acid export membrane protein
MKININEGIFSIFLGNGTKLVLTLLFTPVLVRLLGQSSYGDYALLISFLSISMIIVNIGMSDGLRKFVAENNGPEWTNNILSFYFTFGSLAAIFSVFILYICNYFGIFSPVVGYELQTHLYIIGVIIIFRQYFRLVRSSLMGVGAEHISEPLNVIRRFIFSILSVIFIITGQGVMGVLIADLLSNAISTGIGLLKMREYYKFNFRSLLDTNEHTPIVRLLSFNIYSVILLLLNESMVQFDILLLHPLAGSRSAGIYKSALQVAEFTWFVPNIIHASFLHSMSELWSEGEHNQINKIIGKATRLNSLVTGLLSIGLFILAKPFITFYYGTGFTEAVAPLIILIPGALAFGLSRPVVAVGHGKGSVRVLILGTSLSATINVILNLMLIPRFGLIGAAVATSIGYSSMLVFHLFLAYKIGFDPLTDIRLLKVFSTMFISIILMYLVESAINSSLYSLIIVPPFGFLVYTSLALRLEAVDESEVEIVISRLPSPVRRVCRMYVRHLIPN